jgi:hypothetical protein
MLSLHRREEKRGGEDGERCYECGTTGGESIGEQYGSEEADAECGRGGGRAGGRACQVRSCK